MMRRRVGALGLACHRWAVAVAGFGQKLKRDPRVSDACGWSDILSLAQAGRGADPSGERAAFVQLVRAADEAHPLADGR